MRPLREVLALSAEYLRGRGSPTPRLDAELLLAHALSLSRVDLYVHADRPLTEPELDACRALVARRGAREPVAYITGRRPFRRLELMVDRRVLVPRPETELVVDRCLELLRGAEAPAVVDVGTGSGAIAVALALEHPGARVTAVDDSPDALAVARANADAAGADVELVRSDLLAGLAGRTFDLVVSNPPYVSAGDVDALEPEVSDYEPRVALVGGEVGTEVAERLAAEARDHLAGAGALVLECGDGQGARLADALAGLGYGDVDVAPDLAGHDRIVTGRWSA